MNPLSIDIKDLLVAQNIGIFGIDLFVGKEPADPANCVTIYDTGGIEQNAKFALDESTIQIRARNSDYLQGYEKLNDIKKIVEGKEQMTINNTNYVGFWTMSNVAFVKYDENDRSIWTVNFRITREPEQSETGNRQLIGG